MKNKSPLVSIIIPAFRTELYITPFINSLSKTKYPNLEFLIVFDPSPDKGLQMAKKLVKKDKRWQIVENRERLGSTKCLNLGIKMAKGEFIAFISCDILVDPNWMSELMDYLLPSKRTVGATIAKFFDYHQHDRIQVYRLYLMRETGWVVSQDLGKTDGPEYQKPIETFNGFEGLVVRKEVFDRVGLFDEDVDALIYDLDMTWRVWLGGYKIVQVPSSKVYHWSLKIGRQNAKWEFFYSRMINLFIKNYSFKSLILYLPQYIAIYSLRALFILLKGNSDPLVGWVNSVAWTIKTLPKMLKKRKVIQNEVRRVSDEYLFNRIFYKGSVWSFYRYFRKTQKEIAPILLNEHSGEKGVITHSAE